MAQDEIDKLVQVIMDSKSICQKEVLTFDEAVRYTGIKRSTLYKLTSKQVIPHSKPNGKMIFFRRVELEQWLMSNPVATTTDLTAAAQAYCMTHRENKPKKIK